MLLPPEMGNGHKNSLLLLISILNTKTILVRCCESPWCALPGANTFLLAFDNALPLKGNSLQPFYFTITYGLEPAHHMKLLGAG